MKIPYKFRFLNMLYAHLMGFFWLPCPLCGDKSGGHEWNGESWYYSPSEAIGVCPKKECQDKAKAHNQKMFKEWGWA